jgi:hypothetical protein
MNDFLTILLRIAGAGLVSLAFLHIPIGRRLRWREDAARLTPANRQIFHVHTFFICLVVFLMGLPCLLAPRVFLEPTLAGAWVSASCSVFWAARLYCQFFVYRADLWRGRRMETFLHWGFSLVWLALAALFAVCAFRQVGGLP